MTTIELMSSPTELLDQIWIPAGLPGFSGDDKQHRTDRLNSRFGDDGWRWRFVVRGEIVDFNAAIAEYEESYRVHLKRNPAMVAWLIAECGNVYDHSVDNVHDDSYLQPGPAANHYQDISVRRVIAEITEQSGESGNDPGWGQPTDLIDLGSGESHNVPLAFGFRGRHIVQIRDAMSPGYFLNPALVPVHDPALISTLPNREEWYHAEGCAHLSVEAFWQMSKIVEIRYDRFLALGDGRNDPLAGL